MRIRHAAASLICFWLCHISIAQADTVITPSLTPWQYVANVCVAPAAYGSSEDQAVTKQLGMYYTNACGTGHVESVIDPWSTPTVPSGTCGENKTSYVQAGVEITGHKSLYIRTPPQQDYLGNCTSYTYLNGMLLGKSRILSCPPGSYFDGYNCIVPTNNPLPDRNDCDDCEKNGTDPIRTATGYSYQTERDFVSPGSALRFERFYTSATHRDPTALGKNWRHTYSRSILAAIGPGITIQTAAVSRPGSGRQYFTNVAGVWTPAAGMYERLEHVAGGGWIYTDNSDVKERYSEDGLLLSIEYKTGKKLTLQYSNELLNAVVDDQGRTLTFAYQYFDNLAGQPETRLTSVGLPDGQMVKYQYDANGMLERAIYADATPAISTDNPYRRYQYGDGVSAQNYQLIGLYDERAIQFTNWQFDSAGRATSSEHGTPGSGIDKVSLAYNAGTSTTITNQYGQSRIYSFNLINNTYKTASISGNCPLCGGGNISAITFDANGNPDIETDFAGTTTDTDYNNPRGLWTQKIEAANESPSAPVKVKRTSQIDWHTSFRVPTERRTLNANGVLEAKTKYAYNSRGQTTAICQVDPSNSIAMAYVCGSAVNAPVGVRQNTTSYCEQADVTAGICPLIGLVISTNGSRIDVTDVTTSTYYQTDDASCVSTPTVCPHRKGDLWKVTNALNQTVEYLAYDGAGRVLKMKGANNVITDMEYNARGWLTARKVRGLDDADEFYDDAITRVEYDAAGQVVKITQPDGYLVGKDFINFTYDAVHRLTGITDADNNSITYILDNAGKRTSETTQDPNGVLTRNLSRAFDSLGRLQANKNAANTVIATRTYDANNNLNTNTDGLNRITDQDVDPLNRLFKIVQDQGVGKINATSQFAYDARDNLRTVTDPKGLITSYTYNGLNDLTLQSSPDTGSTSYTYDDAGNRKTQIDAKGTISNFTYDALNRLISLGYTGNSGLNSSFIYDTVNIICGAAESFSKGRLTKFTDPSGNTQYCYDRFGNLTRKQITNNNIVSTFVFEYWRSGRLLSVTYPSGMKVGYGRNNVGQVSQITVTQNGTTKVFANNITYYPFGPLSKIEFLPPNSPNGNPAIVTPTGVSMAAAGGGCIPQPGGGCSPPPPSNPVIQTRVYDNNYAVQSIGGLNYNVDVLGNIVNIADAAGGNIFEYDNLDRLNKVKDSATLVDKAAFTYDPTGNRLSKKVGTNAIQPYVYATTNHRLSSVDGITRTLDSNGNTTKASNTKFFTYDARNRMASFKTGQNISTLVSEYQYNGKGERVRKYRNSVDQARYAYSENGQLLVEEQVNAGVTTIQEIIWLDDMPIGLSQNGVLHGILADHLNSPRAVFEIATQKKVWQWNLADDAFGESLAVEDPDANGVIFKFDMRFPGQFFDIESGLHYNYLRDYETQTGRYMQSDPIGLKGGVATYSYVDGSPLAVSDREGLAGSKLPPSNYLKECDAVDWREAEARCSPNSVLKCKRNYIRKLGSGLHGNLIWNYVKADLQVECEEGNFCQRNPGTCATLTTITIIGLILTPWPDDVLIPVVLGCGAGAAAGS